MSSTVALPRTSFWQSRWWIVVASFFGMITSPGSALIFTFSVFLVPVTAETGWTRGQFASAMIVTGFASTITAPIMGRLMDRYGIRPIALPALTIFSLALASFSLMSGSSIWPAYLIFGTCSCFSSSCGPIVYSKAITAWFDKERGLALGLATAGVGIGTAVLPLAATFLISHFGWRLGYVGIAAMTWVIAGTVISLFIREPPGYLERLRAAREEPLSAGPQPLGMSFRAAVTGTRQFWILAAIFIAVGTANNGSLGHLVAMLIDRGYTPGEAAGILSSTGLAAFAARIAFGFCLDWLAGPRLAAAIMLLPACGIALLWSGWGGSAPLIAAILCGLGNGAEVDLLGFFVSRYFGRRSFGAIYGMLFSCFTIGIGIGPAILGHFYDTTHSYEGPLLAFVFVLLAAGGLFLALGRYNYPKGAE